MLLLNFCALIPLTKNIAKPQNVENANKIKKQRQALRTMKIHTFIFFLFSIIASTVNGQNQLQTEDEDNLYWQPEVKINYSHFQSESDEDCIMFNKQYGLKMSANIQLHGIVDIPKSYLSRKIEKRTGYDKAYLAPIFCKNCSCMLTEDSVELVVYQLLFDVAEMCARGSRKELLETQEQMNINNVNTMFFTTVKNKWDERMRGTWASILQDVLIQKKDNAYAEWRKLVNALLEANKDFSTQPNEIKRLILGKPIEQDYVQAKSIIGDLKTNAEN